mmetsp:Transcript_2590/g.6229  ORF Transcript_2590/g.6229 Transcript_2590/m.6229 type:complete len:239 (-) Transcript_2590:135-851(-)
MAQAHSGSSLVFLLEADLGDGILGSDHFKESKVPRDTVWVVGDLIDEHLATVGDFVDGAGDHLLNAESLNEVLWHHPWRILENKRHEAALKDATQTSFKVLVAGVPKQVVQCLIGVDANKHVGATLLRLLEDALVASMEEIPGSVHVHNVPAVPWVLCSTFCKLHQLRPKRTTDGLIRRRWNNRLLLGWLQDLTIHTHGKAGTVDGVEGNDDHLRILFSQLAEPALADLTRPQWIQLV